VPAWAIFAMLLGLAAIVVASAASWLAYDNMQRADDWEARAFRLERNTEQLNGLLAERSTQLNERTRELNRIAGKVTRQQNALAESELDVQTLSKRQRELAAEKAAVEDSRADLEVQATALENVADALVACNGGLFQLFGYLVAGDRAAADAIVDSVSADCAAAESRFADYRLRYG
jgi:hypothetical protein